MNLKPRRAQRTRRKNNSVPSVSSVVGVYKFLCVRKVPVVGCDALHIYACAECAGRRRRGGAGHGRGCVNVLLLLIVLFYQ